VPCIRHHPTKCVGEVEVDLGEDQQPPKTEKKTDPVWTARAPVMNEGGEAGLGADTYRKALLNNLGRSARHSTSALRNGD